LLLHRIWVTVLVAIPVLAWMGFFLLIWPSLVVSSGGFTDVPTPAEFDRSGDEIDG
jgi:hypothetical protein